MSIWDFSLSYTVPIAVTFNEADDDFFGTASSFFYDATTRKAFGTSSSFFYDTSTDKVFGSPSAFFYDSAIREAFGSPSSLPSATGAPPDLFGIEIIKATRGRVSANELALNNVIVRNSDSLNPFRIDGFRRDLVSATGDFSVNPSRSYAVFHNLDATQEIDATLDVSSPAGTIYTFVNASSGNPINILGDSIVSSTGIGPSIQLTDFGSKATIMKSPSEWIVIDEFA